jgi:hypothetical protein
LVLRRIVKGLEALNGGKFDNYDAGQRTPLDHLHLAAPAVPLNYRRDNLAIFGVFFRISDLNLENYLGNHLNPHPGFT